MADKVDVLFEVMKAQFEKVDQRFDKQDAVLEKLTSFRWMVLGGATAVGGLGGFLATIATLYFYSKGVL